jgi:hypothetical protein
MTLLLVGLLVVSADPVVAGTGTDLAFDTDLIPDPEFGTDGGITTDDAVDGGGGPTNP